jgi:hypothetical protein
MRAGFSRVDLLAVVFMLGLGAGAAAPAVHQANAKQDRATSINNLKQLVLATHNAHDSYAKFPQISGTLGGKDATLHYQLLPFIEQGNLYQSGDLSVVVKEMVGPGDRSAPAGGVYKRAYGTTNFAGNWLVFKGGPLAPGFGGFNQIVDGTSNTVMFAERYQMCNGTPCLWGYSQYYYWAPMFAYFSQGKFQVHPPQEACDPALPQSIHREGILVGMCDGVVRTVGDQIGADTWAHVVCPNDGQVLPGEWGR